MALTDPELLEAARLVNALYDRDQAIPPGWAKVEQPDAILSPRTALVFEKGKTILIAFKGVEIFSLRDILGIIPRRLFGYSRSNERYVRSVLEDRSAGQRLILAGHSGGGGLASYLGSIFRCETACFNSGRNKQSFENDGTQQVVCRVSGDRWSDPDAHPRLGAELPGRKVVLAAQGGENKHDMKTVVAALERMLRPGSP
jgi:hypothetical protein